MVQAPRWVPLKEVEVSEYQEKELICIACQQPFPFRAKEQAFFAEQGYAPPKRCPSCRAERRRLQEQHGRSEAS